MPGGGEASGGGPIHEVGTARFAGPATMSSADDGAMRLTLPGAATTSLQMYDIAATFQQAHNELQRGRRRRPAAGSPGPIPRPAFTVGRAPWHPPLRGCSSIPRVATAALRRRRRRASAHPAEHRCGPETVSAGTFRSSSATSSDPACSPRDWMWRSIVGSFRPIGTRATK